MHHPHDELGGCPWLCLNSRFAFIHVRHDIRRVIGLFEYRGTLCVKAFGPAALVFQLSVQLLPALALFLGVDERKLCPRDHRNIRPSGDFQQAKSMLRLFLHPLIAAHGRNPKDVELVRLQKNQ
jgi:hypothetical protein